jgi:hypothetical protein
MPCHSSVVEISTVQTTTTATPSPSTIVMSNLRKIDGNLYYIHFQVTTMELTTTETTVISTVIY